MASPATGGDEADRMDVDSEEKEDEGKIVQPNEEGALQRLRRKLVPFDDKQFASRDTFLWMDEASGKVLIGRPCDGAALRTMADGEYSDVAFFGIDGTKAIMVKNLANEFQLFTQDPVILHPDYYGLLLQANAAAGKHQLLIDAYDQLAGSSVPDDTGCSFRNWEAVKEVSENLVIVPKDVLRTHMVEHMLVVEYDLDVGSWMFYFVQLESFNDDDDEDQSVDVLLAGYDPPQRKRVFWPDLHCFYVRPFLLRESFTRYFYVDNFDGFRNMYHVAARHALEWDEEERAKESSGAAGGAAEDTLSDDDGEFGGEHDDAR